MGMRLRDEHVHGGVGDGKEVDSRSATGSV